MTSLDNWLGLFKLFSIVAWINGKDLLKNLSPS